MKINTMALRRLLQAELLKACPRVFFEEAPQDATKPYVVYNLGIGRDNRPSVDYLMDVDVWHSADKVSSAAIEDLADEVEETLDEALLADEDCSLVAYKNTRFSSDERDYGLLRRRITFDLRVYFS